MLHGQPAVEQREHRGDVVGDALLRQEDPVDRPLQVGARLEVLDAVVPQGPLQPRPEAVGQPLALGVQRVQVGVEVLARTVDLLVGFLLLARRAVAGELGQVGERREDGDLAVQQLVVGPFAGRRQLAAGGAVRRHELPCVLLADVVTGDQRPQRAEEGPRPVPGVRRRAAGGLRQRDTLAGRLLGVAAGPVDGQQRGPGVHLRVGPDEHVADPAGERRPHRRLHLHALQHDDRLAGLDLVPRRRAQGHHHRRRGGADDAAGVPGHAVGDAVDLDQVGAGRLDGHDRPAVAADGQPALQRAQPVDLDGEVPVVEPHPVAVGADPRHGEPVHLPAQAELDGSPHLVRRPRAAAPGRRQEGGPLPRLLGVRDVDRHLDQGHPGIGRRRDAAGGPRPVEPPGVGRAGHDLGAVQQIEEEGLGRGPAPQDDGGLAQRDPQPGERLRAVPAPGDDLGDHRVVLRRDDVALAEPGVDPHPRAGGQAHQLDAARGRGEALLGVLGVQPRLHRVTGGHRRIPLEATAVGHVQLQLHEVETGGLLGDGVLDLQPGVHLEEREQLLVRLVQELHGARADVAGRLDQRDRGVAQRLVLLGGQRRGAGLLQHLLVAPLHRAVADAGGPHRSVLVGDHLHLDVPAALDQPLHEDDRVAERAAGLGLRPDRARPRARPRSGRCGYRVRRRRSGTSR